MFFNIELLRTKKITHAHEKTLLEEKSLLVKDMQGLRSQLTVQQDRTETVEQVLERPLIVLSFYRLVLILL